MDLPVVVTHWGRMEFAPPRKRAGISYCYSGHQEQWPRQKALAFAAALHQKGLQVYFRGVPTSVHAVRASGATQRLEDTVSLTLTALRWREIFVDSCPLGIDVHLIVQSLAITRETRIFIDISLTYRGVMLCS